MLIGVLSCQLAVPLYFRNAIDSILAFGDLSGFVKTLFMLTALMATSATLSWAFSVLATWVGESLTIDITSYAYDFVLTCRRSFWQKFSSDDVLTRLTQDILSVKSLSVDLLHSILSQCVSVVATLGIMFYFSKWVAFLYALFMPTTFVFAYWSDQYLNKHAMDSRSIASSFTGKFRSGLSNPSENFSWKLSSYHHKTYLESATKMKAAQIGLINRTQIISQTISMASFLVTSVCLLFILRSDYGRANLSPGEVFALVVYGGQTAQVVVGMARSISGGKVHRVAVSRLRELFMFHKHAGMNSELDSLQIIRHPFFKGSLREGIALPSGDRFVHALKADNGTGKTTLGQILSGFDDLGGNVSKERWFLLSSDPPVFFGNLLDNIRIISGCDISENDVLNVLGKNELIELLSLFPDGFGTPVSDKTEMLSRGQRQAISLMSAIVNDPQMVFVDEGLNSLDNRIRHIIRTPLRLWLGLRKSIVVEHDAYLMDVSATPIGELV